MDPSESDPHMRACGKWIVAGGPRLWGHAISRPSQGHGEWLAALKSAEDFATASSGNAKDAMSKFRTECLRTTAQGSHAVHTAAKLAYGYMDAEISQVRDEDTFFRAIGFVAGHGCEGPVQIDNSDLSYDYAHESFRVRFREGYKPPSGVLSQSLQLMSAGQQLALRAEAANREIQAAALEETGGQIKDRSKMLILSGAMGADDLDEHSTSGVAMHGSSKMLASTVSHYNADPGGALDYLRGLSAFCVLSLVSNVENVGPLLRSTLREIRASRPWTPSLRTPYVGTEGVVNETLLASVTITLSTLSGDGDGDCLQLMHKLFPDDLEERRFSATVDLGLYQRLESLVQRVRDGMQQVVMKEPLSGVLKNASQAREYVRNVGLRISGAPRGTWAGLQRDLARPELSSSDGMFVMALKQSRATFRNDMPLSLERADRCDGVLSFGQSTVRNAYLRYGIPDCSNLFLGMATRPYLDAQYDDDSLMSRGVAIIAHELGHAIGHASYFRDELNIEQFEILLNKYNIDFGASHTRTYQSEAFADLAAALAVVESGVDRSTFLTNWCQMWCARVPFGWQPYAYSTHPEHNQRCDFLHNTLESLV